MSRRWTPPPWLVLAIGILAVSTASLFIRYAQQEAPSPTIAAYRLALATLILTPWFWKHRADWRAFSRATWAWALLSGALLALHFLAWITSLEYTTVASSVVLVTTTPLWVALFSFFLLGERLSRPLLFGLTVAFAGGVLMALGDVGSPPPLAGPTHILGLPAVLVGDLLALVGAWAAAGYLMVGRHLRKRMPFPVYLFVVYGTAAVLSWAFVGLRDLPWKGFSPSTYLWLVLLGLVPQLIGHSSFNWALRHLPTPAVAAHLLGEPVGSTLLALVFLGEKPPALSLTGAVLVLIGLVRIAQHLETE